MVEIGFECVQPSEDHARLIFAWRNDPTTRAMSFHTDVIKWDYFYSHFLRDYFAFPEHPPLFCLVEGQRVGFIHLEPAPDPKNSQRSCCVVSINVAPEWRGKGLGKQILTSIQPLAACQGIDDLYAEVKKENAISHKIFLKAGFELLHEKEKRLSDTGEGIPICCYLAMLSPEKREVCPVFVIAEAGSNWRMGTPSRDRAMAKALIDVAVEARADAVKFQVYRPESIYVENAGKSAYLSKAGIEEEIRDIFADLTMPYEMIVELAEYCQKQGIQFMATPFSRADFEAVDPFVAVHKIASYEIGHIRLIELAAQSGKALVMSTGAATVEEIAWAVDSFHENGGRELTLMQCTARYPAEPESMNLSVLPWLKKRFQTSVGLSDHSRDPIYAPVSAVALGATAIEKHFTLSNDLPGPDHAFAILPNELKEMVKAIRTTEKMRGSGIKEVHPFESELRAFARRGVQAIREIREGDVLREGENIDILRPGEQHLGVHSRYLAEIEGKRSTRVISLGDGIQWGDWC